MTDLEISKALALAIGWHPDHVLSWDGNVYVDLAPAHPRSAGWQKFDYRDWNVIGPIAEKLIVELIKGGSRGVVCWDAIHGMEGDDDHAIATANTLRKACAMAVIEGAKK